MRKFLSPQVRFLALPITVILLAPALSSATPVAPGQVTGTSGDLMLPIPGTVVAESTRPFHIDQLLRSPVGFELEAPSFVEGNLTTQVIRNDQSGQLAFYYTFDFTQGRAGNEESKLQW